MGVLDGLTVVEFAGLGPVPFAAMMLADHGANVIRIDRPGGLDGSRNVLMRNRSCLALDLKAPGSIDVVMRLISRADALIEPYRPGVMERLGIGPDKCLERNPKLVYGRMTGWGQTGPLAAAAGHDINYVSLVGVTHAVGRAGEAPVPPLNLVGDYGGGGMLLAFGVMAAAWSATRTGKGQVIDAAMVDGASILMAEYWGFLGRGEFTAERGTHLLDGGAPFYQVYETKDAQHISIGPLEPKFYVELLTKLGLDVAQWQPQNDPAMWPRLKKALATVFLTQTRAHWSALLEGTDVCFSPVLSMAEAAQHPHIKARNTIIDVAGMQQPAPAPRFERTPSKPPKAGGSAGTNTRQVLSSIGYEDVEIDALLAQGVVQQD